MKASKRKKKEQAGSTSEFLAISDEKEMLVNMKLALASKLRQRRQQLKLTQRQLAKRIGSSQSRVAKMEVADSSVSLELIVRSLASLGATQAEIGKIIGTRNGSTKLAATG